MKTIKQKPLERKTRIFSPEDEAQALERVQNCPRYRAQVAQSLIEAYQAKLNYFQACKKNKSLPKELREQGRKLENEIRRIQKEIFDLQSIFPSPQESTDKAPSKPKTKG